MAASGPVACVSRWALDVEPLGAIISISGLFAPWLWDVCIDILEAGDTLLERIDAMAHRSKDFGCSCSKDGLGGVRGDRFDLVGTQSFSDFAMVLT